MIYLIDNYDSFSYNLYQLIGEVDPAIEVLRNDALTVEELEEKNPEAVILSPGPGRPADAGICEEVALKLSGKVPILGVCLSLIHIFSFSSRRNRRGRSDGSFRTW